MVNTNRLFVALKGADRARLAPHMRRFELLKDAVLYEIGDPIDTLYFPLSGQVALVIVSEDGSETESTSIGNNGVVGLGGLISGDKSFTCQRVQVAGEALALPRGPFLQVYHESRDLRNSVAAHQDAFTAQLLQSVHCQGNHLVDQRVARWLLSAFELTLDEPLDLITLLSLIVLFPLAVPGDLAGTFCFTGLRHFLFLISGPCSAVRYRPRQADYGAASPRPRGSIAAGSRLIGTCLLWDATTLVRLHPYEYLYYNSLVGGLEGASRRYDLDYWFGSMPEAIDHLEAYLRRTEPGNEVLPTHIYSVAVCGERLPFEKAVTLPQLKWDFRQE